MIKNLKFGKKLISSILVVSVLGGSILTGLHLYKRSEINRVKGYLEDFLTENNYVDLSKINGDYEIKEFDGEILREALTNLDIDYVRFNDSYVYNDPHVEGFIQKTATNYDEIIGVDDNQNNVYVGYEPIRKSLNGEVTYLYPDNYVLEDIHVFHEPIRYDELDNREVRVIKNNYENSYSLVLEKKK